MVMHITCALEMTGCGVGVGGPIARVVVLRIYIYRSRRTLCMADIRTGEKAKEDEQRDRSGGK
jgi:hypothetical protein